MINNFEFKKSLGQNFLKDNNIINKIVDGAMIDSDTLVLEIGPGAGAISEKIISKAGYSILYEIDTRLKEHWESFIDNDNYKIIFKDFLDANVLDDISGIDYKKLYVVANLPYYITTPIITKFIDDEIFPDKIVIMIQKEVADRLTAVVGSRNYGALTVFLNYYYNISKLCDVSRNCFVPVPNVDSTVIVMNLKNNRDKNTDVELFKKLVRDSFQYKRKNLRNNLKEYDLGKIEVILGKYGLSLSDRAEQLSLEVFLDIVSALSCYNN